MKDTEDYFRTTLGGYRFATSTGGTLTKLVGRVGHFSSNTTNLFCNFIVVFNGNC